MTLRLQTRVDRVAERVRPPTDAETDAPRWLPYPGPQRAAYACTADVIGFGGAGGGGKRLAIDTLIATPRGWTTMGALGVGDEVFDERGEPCHVTYCSPIDRALNCWRLMFDDGSTIVADIDHRWLTYAASDLAALTRRDPVWRMKRRAARPSRVGGKKSTAFTTTITARNQAKPPAALDAPTGTVKTTREIIETLSFRGRGANHAIPVTQPLALPDRGLPLDPYLFGCWLGDGSSYKAEITTADAENLEAFHAAGFRTRRRGHYAHGIYRLLSTLKAMGVIGYQRKHVPGVYLRASAGQRLALLRGLMDTDGHAKESGAVEFTSTSRALADAVRDLAVSLGWKARVREGRATLNGKDCGSKYRVTWTPSEIVFRLPRKAARQRVSVRRTTRFRYIVRAEPAEPVEMRCIAVDSPSHLYLAGETMIPTHNTDLLVGKAFTKHHRAMLFRRQKTDELTNMVDRSRDIAPPGARRNETKLLWRGLPGGGVIGFGGLERPEDWKHYRGHGYDFFGFDEATEFLEAQVRSLMGWNRTVKHGQACQVILTFNPPTSAEGEWIIRFFAPWLDPHHPNPAEPGEHRFFAMIDGEEREVETGEPFEKGGELITPKSRTFYPARVQDNPTLIANGYVATLQGLPEPLRSQVLYGDFTAGMEDDEWQVIPTRWVLAAQERGRRQPPPAEPLTALGIDVARGGRDRTIYAPRIGVWLDPLIRLPKAGGQDGEDGYVVATRARGILQAQGWPQTLVMIDATGVGASPYDIVRRRGGYPVVGVIMAESAPYADASERQRFVNTRSWLWWSMRELLDPDRGHGVVLPDDPELGADLCAPRWRPSARGIQVESREEIVARLGRSPDAGTACVLAFAPYGGPSDRTRERRVVVESAPPAVRSRTQAVIARTRALQAVDWGDETAPWPPEPAGDWGAGRGPW